MYKSDHVNTLLKAYICFLITCRTKSKLLSVAYRAPYDLILTYLFGTSPVTVSFLFSVTNKEQIVFISPYISSMSSFCDHVCVASLVWKFISVFFVPTRLLATFQDSYYACQIGLFSESPGWGGVPLFYALMNS